MDRPERLPLGVLAHSVRLEPARTPHRGPAAAFSPCARIREQRLELGDAGPHGHRARPVDDELEVGQAERIPHAQSTRSERVPAPRDVFEDESRASRAPHRDGVLAEGSDALLPLETRGEPAAAPDLDVESQRLSLDRSVLAGNALDPDRARDEA